MTPHIRMVSVPVEDLLFYKLKDLILEQSEGEWDDATIVRDAHHFANHIRPLLTAAPVREEGGAKSIWSDARSMFVRYAELFAMTDRYEEASVIADKAAREIEALATREEAPDWTARTEAAWAENNREETPADHVSDARQMVEAPAEAGEPTQEMIDAAVKYCADATGHFRGWARTWMKGCLRAALRAQPPAREEAQPVAVTIFCPECSLPHVDEGEWATTRRHKTHQCQGCGHEWRPFPFATVGVSHPTTPPAPEAEKIIDRYEMADALLASGIAIGVSTWPDEQRRDALSLADAALAALQQEGRDHG